MKLSSTLIKIQLELGSTTMEVVLHLNFRRLIHHAHAHASLSSCVHVIVVIYVHWPENF